MNRFKFRVWDKEDKDMYYQPLSDISEGEVQWFIPGYSTWDVYYDATNEQERFVIMQSTNKTDKNGKLIYEQDLLISDEEEPYMIRVEWDNNMSGFIVKTWNGEYFEYGLSDDTVEDLSSFIWIGNTYQSIDLLKVKSLV